MTWQLVVQVWNPGPSVLVLSAHRHEDTSASPEVANHLGRYWIHRHHSQSPTDQSTNWTFDLMVVVEVAKVTAEVVKVAAVEGAALALQAEEDGKMELRWT